MKPKAVKNKKPLFKKIKWTEELTNQLQILRAENKSIGYIADKMGLIPEQVSRRVAFLKRIEEEQRQNEENKRLGDKNMDIPVIKSASIAIGAVEINGSYYLDGKRILVGEMIRRARGGL